MIVNYIYNHMKYVPLRSFIFDRLYHPSQGYFCKPNFQVGQLKSPINFKDMIGYDDYQRQLIQKYPPNAWLTPCEIFKPYYGMTIAKYIKTATEQYKKQGSVRNKIRIVEAGAGTGTAAQSILYYFSNFHRELLPLIEYNIVQISPTLSKRIQQKLTKSYPHLIKNKQIKIINQNILDYKQQEPCFILFFQVLDNFPHDKVIWNQDNQVYDKYVTACIEDSSEAFQPIQNDLLIKECLDLYLKMKVEEVARPETFIDRIAEYFVKKMLKKTKNILSKDLFLPTYLLRLFKQVKKNMPKAHLVISDFDQLITSIDGINAPIVSKKGFKSQQKQDFNTYLIKRGEADIFFPVNFHFAQHLHQEILGRQAHVVKSYEFIDEFSEENWARTKSNFNPIKQDFGNTSFLVTSIQESK